MSSVSAEVNEENEGQFYPSKEEGRSYKNRSLVCQPRPGRLHRDRRISVAVSRIRREFDRELLVAFDSSLPSSVGRLPR